jgi:hypothetical protein
MTLTKEQLDRLEETAEMIAQNGRAYTPSTETLLSLITMARSAIVMRDALEFLDCKRQWSEQKRSHTEDCARCQALTPADGIGK